MEARVYPNHTRLLLTEFEGGRRESFVLEKCIGSGASCVAYRALAGSGAPVKLKQFRPRGLERGGAAYAAAEQSFLYAYRQQLDMLQDERISNITASLFHLYRDSEGCLWTSVNDVVGRTLDKLLRDCSLNSAAAILRCVAESTKAYHESGWLLLDLKPENILAIDSPGISGVNFFDFDSFLSIRELQSAVEQKRRLLLSSSPAFSAPELQSSPVDLNRIGPAADRYSVGAILFFALFGRAPSYFDCMPGVDYDFSSLSEERGQELFAAARDAVGEILRRTLTMMPEDRFDSDDELLRAINDLLRLTDRGRPYLSRRMPSSVGSYVGREEEQKQLLKLLHAKKSTYDEILGGGELEFYYIDFKGSVRSTILSLPIENLSRTRPDPQGGEMEVPEEELYRSILRCLEESCGKNAVLIVDNFDGPDDSKTPLLREEEAYRDLLRLPLRLLFTTRCRFDDACCMTVGSLAETELLTLMEHYLPGGQDRDTLRRIIRTVGSHTLTVDIIARTLRESKGTLDPKKLLAQLEKGVGEKERAVTGLSEHLNTVFRVADFGAAARSVLACACLFPLRGLDTGLMFSALDAEHWGEANRLERSGWLHYDDFSNAWSMHPLVRLICERDSRTAPTRQRVLPFIAALRTAESSLLVGPDRVHLDRQLTEVYANYVRRLDMEEPKPTARRWILYSATAVVLAALVFFTVFARRDNPVWVQLAVRADASASVADVVHDKTLLLARLQTLLGREPEILEQTEESLRLRFPLSETENADGLDFALRYFLSEPNELYLLSTTLEENEIYELISRESILAARVDKLPLEDADAEILDEGIVEGTPCLYLQLDETATAVLERLRAESDSVMLCCDPDPDADFWQAYLFGGGEDCGYYLIDPELRSAAVYRLLAYNLTHEALHNSLSCRCRFEPEAIWEEKSEASSWGRFQCAPEDLKDGLVLVSLAPSSGSAKFISDFSYQQITQTIKRRLDLIGQPYALGRHHIRERELVILTPAQKLNEDILKLLVRSDFQFTTKYYCADTLLSAPSAVEIQKNKGGCSLVLRYEGGSRRGDRQQLKRWTEELLSEGENRIYLEQDGYLLASAQVKRPVINGTLVFDSLPFLGEDKIPEDELYILQLLAQTLGEKAQLSDFYYGYYLDDWQLLDGAAFGLQRSDAEDRASADIVRAFFPNAKVYRSEALGGYNLCVELELEPGPAMVPEFLQAVETLLGPGGLDGSLYDSLCFLPRSESEGFRFRFLASPSLSGSEEGAPRRFDDQTFLLYGDARVYREQLESELEERPFFSGAWIM